MTWSDEVPTEPGQYFAMYPGCDKSEPLILTPAGAFFVVGNDYPVDMEVAPYCGTKFCRIPTPEELEAMRKKLHELEFENFEWLKAARMLNNATTDEQESKAIALISELRLGNSEVMVPAEIQKTLIEYLRERTQQRDSAESELERVREQLAEIHQSWGFRNEH